MMQFTGLLLFCFVSFFVFFLTLSSCACDVYSESLLGGLRQPRVSAGRHGGPDPKSSPEESAIDCWSGRTASVSSDLNMEPQTPFHLFMDTVRRSIDFYTYMCVYVHA